MKHRWKIFVPLLFIGLSLQSPSSRSAMAVYDAAHIYETVAQIVQLSEQIEQLYQQITLAETHLTRISGLRGMESLLSSVYDNEVDSVLNDLDEIMRVANLLEAKTALSPDEQRFTRTQDSENDLWDQENQLAAKWQGQTEKYLDSTVNRFSELKKLISKLAGTPEQKDVLDLQARAQSENSMLINEQMKMKMLMSQLEAEERVLARKRQQAAVQDSRDDVNYEGLFEEIDWQRVFVVEEGK